MTTRSNGGVVTCGLSGAKCPASRPAPQTFGDVHPSMMVRAYAIVLREVLQYTYMSNVNHAYLNNM